MTGARVRVWDRPIAAVIAVAIALAIYAPTVMFTTVQYDDEWLWADDSPLRTPSVAVLHDVFFDLDRPTRHALGSEYLPVRDVSVAIDMAIWGTGEHGPHVTQLLLLALTTLALGFLLIRLGVPRPIAWLGTIVWTAHPLHVETIAWVSERKGVLAGLLVFALGHAWLSYRRGGSRWWLAAAMLAGVAATWSKAPAMFAPAAFAAIDLLLLRASPRRRWLAIGAVGGAVALAALPVVIVANRVGVVGVSDGGRAGRFATALGVHGHYLAGLVLARAPSLSYPISSSGPSAIDLAIGIAGVLALAATAAWLWRRRATSPAAPWGLALIAWAAIWFAPISHLIAPIHITVADRYAYLWSLAGCVAIAWALEQLGGIVRTTATAGLIGLCTIATIRAENAWTSSYELFTRAFAANPDDAQVCENLALAQSANGDQRAAVATLDEGLARHPGAPYLLERKSAMLDILGDLPGALAAEQLATATGIGSALDGYAVLLARAGRPAEALTFAERAVARHPESEPYARTEAELLIALGRPADAEPVLERALALAPNASADHLMLAKVLIALGRGAEARRHLDAAARDEMHAAEVTALRHVLDGTHDLAP